MSAPSVSGCCRYGVANVLSTTTSAPGGVGERRHIASMSMHAEQRVGRRLQPHHGGVVGPARASVEVGQVDGGPGDPERSPHLGDQAERAAVGVVAEHDPLAGTDEPQHVVLGGQPAGERQPVTGGLQRGDARLQRGARRVARAGVLEAAVVADAVLGERGRQRDRRHDRARHRVRRLTGVHGTGVEPERRGGLLIAQLHCPSTSWGLRPHTPSPPGVLAHARSGRLRRPRSRRPRSS